MGIGTRALENLNAAKLAILRKLIGVNDEDGRLPSDQLPAQIVGPIIPRSGTKAEIDGIVLELGERAFYTDIDGHAIGDGVTVGGFPEIVKQLGADLNLSGTANQTVLEIETTLPAGSFWAVEFGCILETGASIDPMNFRLEINGARSAGAFAHPGATDPGPETHAVEIGDYAAAVGVSGGVVLAGMVLKWGAGTSIIVQGKQLVDRPAEPTKIRSGAFLKIRRVA